MNFEEVDTKNPIEAYEYWAGGKPPKDLQLIHGEYWRSDHFTLEYILYLEFITSKEWVNEFVSQNGFVADTFQFEFSKPDWFNPSDNFTQYKLSDETDQGTRFYYDPFSGKCFLYEIQL